MNQNLLSFLVCPLCKAKLHYNKPAQELICQTDRLAYPICDAIPVMLAESARTLSQEEYERLTS